MAVKVVCAARSTWAALVVKAKVESAPAHYIHDHVKAILYFLLHQVRWTNNRSWSVLRLKLMFRQARRMNLSSSSAKVRGAKLSHNGSGDVGGKEVVIENGVWLLDQHHICLLAADTP